MTEVKLETPDSPGALYEGRGEDASLLANRPLFTGDVFELEDGTYVCLIQHPCAMRRGTKLVEKILACEVVRATSSAPADWSTGSFKRFFLLGFFDDGAVDGWVEFTLPHLVGRADLERAPRVAVLSQRGVNLLVQRWLYHNSRVTVPTITIHRQVEAQHEEADLSMEAIDGLVDKSWPAESARTQVDGWLDQSDEDGLSMRACLDDPQRRSTVRRQLRTLIGEAPRR